MDPEYAALLEEIRQFKNLYAGNLPVPGPDFSYLAEFPRLTNYVQRHGVLPPMVFNNSDSESDPEEPEENEEPVDIDGYLSNPEFEDEDEEEEMEEDDEEHPGFDMNEWLADYEAVADEEVQEQNIEDSSPESEPESEVDDPAPPAQIVSMKLPSWAPVHGHLDNLQPGTYVYVEIAPVFPCFWKEHSQRFYLDPVRILEPCVNRYYTIDLPQNYAATLTNKVLYLRVSRTRPVDERRIVSLHLNFADERTYTEIPVAKEMYFDPTGIVHGDPRWKVTWRCYSLTEVTVEKESMLRAYYPWMF